MLNIPNGPETTSEAPLRQSQVQYTFCVSLVFCYLMDFRFNCVHGPARAPGTQGGSRVSFQTNSVEWISTSRLSAYQSALSGLSDRVLWN